MKAAASERPKPTSNSEDLNYSECTWVHNLNGLWNFKTKIIRIMCGSENNIMQAIIEWIKGIQLGRKQYD